MELFFDANFLNLCQIRIQKYHFESNAEVLNLSYFSKKHRVTFLESYFNKSYFR